MPRGTPRTKAAPPAPSADSQLNATRLTLTKLIGQINDVIAFSETVTGLSNPTPDSRVADPSTSGILSSMSYEMEDATTRLEGALNSMRSIIAP